MKRYIYLFICLVMILGLFCGCKKNKLQITINVEDGSTITIDNIKEGSTVDEPVINVTSEVEKIKYLDELGNEFTFDKEVTSNLVLNAIFVYKQYIINFYDYDNTLIESYTLPYGAEITFPDEPTRTGDIGFNYEFKDWTLTATKVTQNLNFKARYSKVYDEMTVTLLNVDGTVLEIEKCDYDSYINSYGEPSIDKDINKYYQFLGWFDKETEKLFDFDMQITKNYTVYPKYNIYDYEDVTLENATISFIGDSISTFYDKTSSVNSLYGGKNQFYYPIYSATVKSVEKTWWYQTYTILGLKLGVNNSWSGSAAFGHSESAGMSDARLKTLDDNGTPNIVVIFLGTNDNVNGHEVENLKKAYVKMIEYISINCVDFSNNTAKIPYIYLFTNGYAGYSSYEYTEERRLEYNKMFKELASQYNNVRIFDLALYITKDNYQTYLGDALHYNADGMKLIADKLVEKLEKDFNVTNKSTRNNKNSLKIVYYKKENEE